MANYDNDNDVLKIWLFSLWCHRTCMANIAQWVTVPERHGESWKSEHWATK